MDAGPLASHPSTTSAIQSRVTNASGIHSIRVGQEKAVIAEEISLIFAYADAVNQPIPINGVAHEAVAAGTPAAAPTEPIRAAINA